MRKKKRWFVAGAALLALGLAGAALAQVQGFGDVSEKHWAYPAIKFLQDRKIVSGRPDGTFGPGDRVTRAEVAQMLYKYHQWRQSRDNTLDHINRGCPACHNVRQMGPQQLDLRLGTLVSRMEGHPLVDGNALYTACKECHQPGGKARLMLRTIVHPIHFNSAIFRESYRGSCFNCHDINAEGKFIVLGKPLEVNERGVPRESPFTPDGKELREDLRP